MARNASQAQGEAKAGEGEEEAEDFDSVMDARAELQHDFALSFQDAEELVLYLCTLGATHPI